MAIGNLKPIKLIQYTQTIDGAGDATEATEVVYKMWAEVTDNGGSRSQSLGRTEMSDSKTFKVNFRNYLITGNYKIEYFGQVYAITNVQRIDEKRFNYLLTGFNTFESSAGGGAGGTTVNPTLLVYNDVTGVMSFQAGNLNGNWLQIFVRDLSGQPYDNRFNERVSIGPGPVTEITVPYLTPPDEVVVSWYIVQSAPPYSILTGTESANIVTTRLSERTFRIYLYGVPNDVVSYTLIDNGVNVYNCEGTNIGFAVGIDEYVALQNADPVNSQYFQITDYRLQVTSQYGPNYLITASPVSPYYQWNPGDTLLYLQAGI